MNILNICAYVQNILKRVLLISSGRWRNEGKEKIEQGEHWL